MVAVVVRVRAAVGPRPKLLGPGSRALRTWPWKRRSMWELTQSSLTCHRKWHQLDSVLGHLQMCTRSFLLSCPNSQNSGCGWTNQ